MADLHSLSDSELRSRLVQYDMANVPLTETTRDLLIRRLRKAMDIGHVSPTEGVVLHESTGRQDSCTRKKWKMRGKLVDAKTDEKYHSPAVPVTGATKAILVAKLNDDAVENERKHKLITTTRTSFHDSGIEEGDKEVNDSSNVPTFKEEIPSVKPSPNLSHQHCHTFGSHPTSSLLVNCNLKANSPEFPSLHSGTRNVLYRFVEEQESDSEVDDQVARATNRRSWPTLLMFAIAFLLVVAAVYLPLIAELFGRESRAGRPDSVMKRV